MSKIDAAIAALTGSIPAYTDASAAEDRARRAREAARDALDRDGRVLASATRRAFHRAIKAWSRVEVYGHTYTIDHSTRPYTRKPRLEVHVWSIGCEFRFSFWPRCRADVLAAAKRAARTVAAWQEDAS